MRRGLNAGAFRRDTSCHSMPPDALIGGPSQSALAALTSSQSAPASFSLGFIQKAITAPSNNKTALITNGNSQFLVRSITYPETSGETMVASAEPTFIKPLADPEKRGATSMGTAHMGPIVNSAKKKARLRQTATRARRCEKGTGAMHASDSSKPATTKSRRARFRSPVRRNTQSLATPPTAFPTTPAKKTPPENNAEFLRLSP